MKQLIYLLVSLCSGYIAHAQEMAFKTKFDDAIPVLNVGTFHMGYTSDATRTAFNPKDPKSIQEVHELAQRFTSFKPTVLVLEATVEQQEELQKRYDSYLKNPKVSVEHPSEIELLAFELGRLSGVKKVYAIDHQLAYNYRVYSQVQHKVDSSTYLKYAKLIEENTQSYFQHLGRMPNVLEMFRMNNSSDYLDYLINLNADMLTYVSSPEGNEGAEEASKFYKRNLLMFANLNKLPLQKTDRVFILMGATHTAFFKNFLLRSPKYRVENTLDYLK